MDRLNGMISMSASMEGNGNDASWLPPGFRFHPTDEELLSFYLASKIHNPNFSDQAISEADLNKCEPWELPGKARMGEKEWYFYSLKDRKYPTGVRTNRATQAGYWKATGKDREVMSSQGPLKGKLVGMKKTLVFYQGRAPKGTKSNWVMHEYRAEDALKNSIKSKSSKDEWVLCRVFHKTPGGKKMALIDLQIAAALINGSSSHNVDARMAKMAATLPGLREVPWNTPTNDQASLPCSQMSGQNMLGHPYTSAQAHISGQSAANMYLPGQCLSGQVASSSYATGLASQNQLSSLLSSIQRGHESGNPLFKSLFQQYSEQVKVERKEDYHVPVMEELEVEQRPEQRPMNLQVPVTMWGEVEVGGQNVNTMVTRGRLSPDSSVSTLECAPSPHFHSTNYMHHPLTRLPSDLESLWLYPDQLA